MTYGRRDDEGVEPEQQREQKAPPHLHVKGGQLPVESASITLPVPPYVGGNARSTPAAEVAPLPSFSSVDERARRLTAWAREESEYLRTHDVGFFSAPDIAGRTGFADEGLYELLPALQADMARLRAACGPGPMWRATRALCDQAAEVVQGYCLLWQRLRQEHGR